MYAVIGLGNPGEKYFGTRHNLGYRVVEALSRRIGAEQPFQCRWSLCAYGRIDGKRVLLAQPLTFMNRSGKAVNEIVKRYSVQPENLLVAYDDLDLSPGVIRLRLGGGSAGHRGVQSIIDFLGTNEFIRLRLGIGKPPPEIDGAGYVLEAPCPDEEALLEEAVDRASGAAEMLFARGLEAAMNIYNRPLQP